MSLVVVACFRAVFGLAVSVMLDGIVGRLVAGVFTLIMCLKRSFLIFRVGLSNSRISLMLCERLAETFGSL
jgi:hypothetical protein